MKITMDKTLTSVAQVNDLKGAMKEFKAMYTDGDLKRVLLDAIQELDDHGTAECQNSIWCADILRCDVSAFPTFSTIWVGATYHVEMVMEKHDRFIRANFYVDHELKVDTKPNMINIQLFKEPAVVTP